jgi:hypothetical protein
VEHGRDGSLGIFCGHPKPMRHAGAKGLVIHVRQIEDSVDLSHALANLVRKLGFELGHVGQRHSLFDRRDDGDGESLGLVELASELLRNFVDELHGVKEGVQSMCQARPMLRLRVEVLSMIRNPNEGERCIVGGAIAGLAGGFAISVMMVASALINGLDVWPSLKAAALPFLGPQVFEPGFDFFAVVAGLTTHFFVSMIWGVVFAVVAFGLSRVATLVAAAAWGLVVWFGMHWVALPLLGYGDVVRAVPVNVALFEHLLFGLAMGIVFLPFQRPYVVRSPELGTAT